MRTHFLHPAHRKKRLGLRPLSEVLRRRMDLTTHNLLPGRLIKNFEVDGVMFQGVERPCELFFCINDIEKSDLDEVA
jgi:hypothetical protein